MSWHAYKRRIVGCFPEFSESFGTGVGLHLQLKDSQLAESVLLQFAAARYACLPIHDSFIVHHGLEDFLQDAMMEAFRDVFGKEINVKSTIGLGEPVSPGVNPIDVDIGDILGDLPPYELRYQKWLETKTG